jgi:hypothetical protein
MAKEAKVASIAEFAADRGKGRIDDEERDTPNFNIRSHTCHR